MTASVRRDVPRELHKPPQAKPADLSNKAERPLPGKFEIRNEAAGAPPPLCERPTLSRSPRTHQATKRLRRLSSHRDREAHSGGDGSGTRSTVGKGMHGKDALRGTRMLRVRPEGSASDPPSKLMDQGLLWASRSTGTWRGVQNAQGSDAGDPSCCRLHGAGEDTDGRGPEHGRLFPYEFAGWPDFRTTSAPADDPPNVAPGPHTGAMATVGARARRERRWGFAGERLRIRDSAFSATCEASRSQAVVNASDASHVWVDPPRPPTELQIATAPDAVPVQGPADALTRRLTPSLRLELSPEVDMSAKCSSHKNRGQCYKSCHWPRPISTKKRRES